MLQGNHPVSGHRTLQAEELSGHQAPTCQIKVGNFLLRIIVLYLNCCMNCFLTTKIQFYLFFKWEDKKNLWLHVIWKCSNIQNDNGALPLKDLTYTLN